MPFCGSQTTQGIEGTARGQKRSGIQAPTSWNWKLTGQSFSHSACRLARATSALLFVSPCIAVGVPMDVSPAPGPNSAPSAARGPFLPGTILAAADVLRVRDAPARPASADNVRSRVTRPPYSQPGDRGVLVVPVAISRLLRTNRFRKCCVRHGYGRGRWPAIATGSVRASLRCMNWTGTWVQKRKERKENSIHMASRGNSNLWG
jgi:hypothetical protein